MGIDYCNGCSMLVVMYEKDPSPFRWCNHHRARVPDIESCDSKYKNKDP